MNIIINIFSGVGWFQRAIVTGSNSWFATATFSKDGDGSYIETGKRKYTIEFFFAI